MDGHFKVVTGVLFKQSMLGNPNLINGESFGCLLLIWKVAWYGLFSCWMTLYALL